jgi:hypothetical protein
MTIITYHAAERFVERHAPELTLTQGRAYLEEQAPLAAHLKEKTIKGDHQWQLDDPYCILVMKKDWRTREWVCVTVLPEPQGSPIPYDEMEMMREHILQQAQREEPEPETVEAVEKVLSSAPRVDLIRPSSDPHVEHQRINQERKLWNRALTLVDSHNRYLQKLEKQQAVVQSDHQNLVEALRLALNAINDASDLIQRVHEIDPSFLTEAFLQPEAHTRSERRKIIQDVREGQKSVVDLA